MRTIRASEFKAKCLAILDEVSRTGETVTILKRGRPVAQVGPPVSESSRYPQDSLKGTVRTLGDIIAPVLQPEDWHAERSEEP